MTAQNLEALGVANSRRGRLAEIRSEAQGDPVAVAELLADPPPEISHLLVVEVLSMLRRSGLRAGGIEAAGRAAALERVNLITPMARAARATRAWAIRQGLRYGCAAERPRLDELADSIDTNAIPRAVLGTDLRRVDARVDIDELGRPVLVLRRGGFRELIVELTLTPAGALVLSEDLRRAALGEEA